MAITIDGSTKLIVLDTTTSWDFHDIYVAIVDWSVLSGNMQYLLPCQGSGKGSLGSGLYTDIIYTLINGWKLQPSGYASGTQVSVTGTLITSDGSAATVAPTVGGAPVWIFKVATNGIIASSGGVTAADVWDYDVTVSTGLSAGKKLNDSALLTDQLESIRRGVNSKSIPNVIQYIS